MLLLGKPFGSEFFIHIRGEEKSIGKTLKYILDNCEGRFELSKETKKEHI